MKLTQFVGEIEVGGTVALVEVGPASLSIRGRSGVLDLDLLELIQHIENFKPSRRAGKVKLGDEPSAPRGRKPRETVRVEAQAQAAVSESEAPKVEQATAQSAAESPSVVQLVGSAAPVAAEPFVEDAESDKLVDAGRAAADGKVVVPDQLAGAKSLKDVLLFFSEHHKITTPDELIDVCRGWRASVPLLQRIDDKALPGRVKTAAETLGIGRAEA